MDDSKKRTRTIFFVTINTIILGVVAVFIFLQLRQNRMEEIFEQDEPLSLLVTVFQDDVPLFNEVFIYRKQTGKAAIIDLPVNAGTLIESLNRVDGLQYIFNASEPAEYREVVSTFLGIPIDFHIFLPLENVETMVDLVEGIEIFISDAQEIISNDSLLLLPGGSVVLDGAKTVDFLTFSDPGETSADRTGRYQRWIQSLFRKVGQLVDYITGPKVMPLFLSYIRSDLDALSFSSLASELVNADLEQVIYQRVLGTERLVDGEKLLLFPYNNGRLLREGVRQTLETLEENTVTVDGELLVRVEILNATDVNGLASRTRALFENYGFDVVRVGNAPETGLESTEIIDVAGNFSLAQRVGEFIGSTKISTQLDFPHQEETEVVIILGEDFDGNRVTN